MTEQAVDLAAQTLTERVGLRLDGSSRARLRRLLDAGARRAEQPREAYVAALLRDERAVADLVERVTVQESAFFRHEEQFEIVARAAAEQPTGVIWSAGCGDGQEAWSLAMLLAERGLAGWSVLATDVSHDAIERARAGRYDDRRLRGLSRLRRRRFLRAVADGAFEVADELRPRVQFAVHNLVREPAPPQVDGRIVLCRNVLIYLEPAEADRLLERLRLRMPADGLLLIGAAESLRPDHPSFVVEREDGVFVLRPRHDQPTPADALPPLDHAAEGERLAASGDHAGAAAAFRRAAERTLSERPDGA